MRNVWYAGYGADILCIGERVQDQRLSGCSGGSLAIGPPGQCLRLRISQAQRDRQRIVWSDFNDPFRHRPSLIRARLAQVEHTRVEAIIDPEYTASNQLHIGIEAQAVEVLLLRWRLDGAIPWRRSQGCLHRSEARDYC
jgi:hypothetical protein